MPSSKPHNTPKDADGYRKLHVPVKRPSKLASLFWWLLGITLAVLFLACVVMAYNAQRGK
jgi:hypothetical protein